MIIINTQFPSVSVILILNDHCYFLFLLFLFLVSLNQELPKPLSEEICKTMDVRETVESSTLACVDDAEVGYTGLVRAQHHKATAF